MTRQIRGLFLSSMFVSSISRNAFFVSTAWIMLVTTNSVRSVALLLIVGTITEFAISGPAGFLADRFKRQTVCIIADLARGLIALALGLSLAAWSSPVALFLAVIFYFAADRIYITAIQSMVPSVCQYGRLVSFNAWFYVGMQAGNLVGAFAIGILLETVSQRDALFAIAACFVASTLLMLGLSMVFRTASPRHRTEASTETTLQTASITLLWRQTRLRKLTIIYAQIYTTGMLINILLSGYVLRELHGTSIEFGYLEAAWAVGSVVASVVLTTTFFGNPAKSSIYYALFASGMCMAAFFVVPSFFPAMVQLAFLGAIYNIARILIDVEIQRCVNDSHLGRVKGVIQTACLGFGLVVYFLIVAFGDSMLPSTIFANYGVCMLITSLLLLLNGLRQARQANTGKRTTLM